MVCLGIMQDLAKFTSYVWVPGPLDTDISANSFRLEVSGVLYLSNHIEMHIHTRQSFNTLWLVNVRSYQETYTEIVSLFRK